MRTRIKNCNIVRKLWAKSYFCVYHICMYNELSKILFLRDILSRKSACTIHICLGFGWMAGSTTTRQSKAILENPWLLTWMLKFYQRYITPRPRPPPTPAKLPHGMIKVVARYTILLIRLYQDVIFTQMNTLTTPSCVIFVKSQKWNNIKTLTEDNNETDNHAMIIIWEYMMMTFVKRSLITHLKFGRLYLQLRFIISSIANTTS